MPFRLQYLSRHVLPPLWIRFVCECIASPSLCCSVLAAATTNPGVGPTVLSLLLLHETLSLLRNSIPNETNYKPGDILTVSLYKRLCNTQGQHGAAATAVRPCVVSEAV